MKWPNWVDDDDKNKCKDFISKWRIYLPENNRLNDKKVFNILPKNLSNSLTKYDNSIKERNST